MPVTTYTKVIPRPAGIPASITVRIVAMRDDAKELSREELEALARVYPPTNAANRSAVQRDIEAAPSRPARVRAKRSSAKTSAPKRKAAKRPTRVRTK